MVKSDQRTGFNTDRYLQYQARKLKAVVNRTHDRLYIEFGGKLIQDKHSARVLPGYREDTKFELLKRLCQKGEVIFVVSGSDILRGRIRGDFGTRYDAETLRTLTELSRRGLHVRHVAITLLDDSHTIPKPIRSFEQRLHARKIQTYRFTKIQQYTRGAELLQALNRNPFVGVRKKLVMIISPGGGSGKFGVCLNQFYHEMIRGRAPRYLKFETFPVHDLPLYHPINLAYMAASADFYDVVMKDKRHRGGATSYNRDLENYELLRFLAKRFPREGRYLRTISSATSMGINMLSRGIVSDLVVQKEAAAEIARRLIRYKFEVLHGKEDKKVLGTVRKILAML